MPLNPRNDLNKKRLPDTHIIEALAHSNAPRTGPDNNHIESWRWRGRRLQEIDHLQDEEPGKAQDNQSKPPVHIL